MSHVQEIMLMISYLLPVFHCILITILSYLITNLELWLFIQLYLTVLVLYKSSLICQILSTTHDYTVRLQAILPYFYFYNLYYKVLYTQTCMIFLLIDFYLVSLNFKFYKDPCMLICTPIFMKF